MQAVDLVERCIWVSMIIWWWEPDYMVSLLLRNVTTGIFDIKNYVCLNKCANV